MIFFGTGLQNTVLTNVQKKHVRQSSVKDIKFQMTGSSTKPTLDDFLMLSSVAILSINLL